MNPFLNDLIKHIILAVLNTINTHGEIKNNEHNHLDYVFSYNKRYIRAHELMHRVRKSGIIVYGYLDLDIIHEVLTSMMDSGEVAAQWFDVKDTSKEHDRGTYLYCALGVDEAKAEQALKDFKSHVINL